MYNSQQGSQVTIGDIPRPTPIRIKQDGAVLNIADYDLTPVLLDPDNKRVDMTGYSLTASDNDLYLNYPEGHSLFLRLGIYTLHMIVETALGTRETTLASSIEVLPLGRSINN